MKRLLTVLALALFSFVVVSATFAAGVTVDQTAQADDNDKKKDENKDDKKDEKKDGKKDPKIQFRV